MKVAISRCDVAWNSHEIVDLTRETSRTSPENRLIPELDVSDLDRSLHFYVDVIGFRVLCDRPEERFAFLDLNGAQLMLEEVSGPGRRFTTAPLERPFGRGTNFQIETPDVDGLHERIRQAAIDPLVPIEARWYRRGTMETGNRQFVVADPDGYLLRFFSDLGLRSLQ